MTDLLNKYFPEGNVFGKLNRLILLMLVFCMPVFPRSIPVLMVFFIVTWLLGGIDFRAFVLRASRSKAVAVSAVFYILHVAGLLYSENTGLMLFDLEVKCSLLLFPLLFTGYRDTYNAYTTLILKMFVWGGVLGSILCLVVASYHTLDTGINHFFYRDVSVFLHPSYFAMYLNFSLVILFYLARKGRISRYYLYIPVSLLFIGMIFLLSSKIGFMVAVIILSYACYWYANRVNRKVAVALTVFVLVTLGVIASQNTRIREIASIAVSIDQYEPQMYGTIHARIFMWDSSLKVIKDHFWIGVSPADVKDALYATYADQHIKYAEEIHLNAHNQFLETFVGLGLIGFVALIALLFTPLLTGSGRDNALFRWFLLIIVINLLFESALNKQAGVVFFAFFYNLMAWQDNEIDHS